MGHVVTERFVECLDILKSKGVIRSYRQFAERLGVHAQSLQSVRNLKRNVTIDMIAKAVESYGLNPMYLYTGKGEIFLTDAENNCKVVTVYLDEKGEENIVHIPNKAQAGYLNAADKMQLEGDCIQYTLPGMQNRFGTYRSFEVAGDSMNPNIVEGDVVICQYVEPNLWHKIIKNHHVYIVITDEDIVLKRLMLDEEHTDTIQLISDNKNMEPYTLQFHQIKELWYVEKLIHRFDHYNTKKDVIEDDKDARLLRFIEQQSSVIVDLKSRLEVGQKSV